DGVDAKCQVIPSSHNKGMGDLCSYLIVGPIQKIKSQVVQKVEGIVGELVKGANVEKEGEIEKTAHVTLDSVHFKGATLVLLAYGENEPTEMENASGHVKFQNNYNRVHVQLSGNCKMWRSDVTSKDGGWLSIDVFMDIVEQKWHANLKVVNLFALVWQIISKLFCEREVAVCLMQKCIDKAAEMQIRSAIALDHLKNYIYSESDKEAHVREHLNVSDGSRRDETILHMLCILNGLLYILMEDKVKVLGARSVVKALSLGVVLMMLCGEIKRARVVSRVVVMIVLLMLRVHWLTLVGGDSEELESDGVRVGKRGLLPLVLRRKTLLLERGTIT
nr:hypothetical protein CTI12_AA149020 [Tanacetum cinerariifolium]